MLEMYGAEPGKPSFANNCLLARRLVERGVRFVQLFHEAWDQHGNLVSGPEEELPATPTRPCAALVKDLKQRGLLDDTLVIWGGEFGRTPMVQGGNDGRDHHPTRFTMWLAGGGIKPGITLGETDEFGFNVVEDQVHVHDLHATLLHLLGFDHTKLTYRFQGRDFRLTDVHGQRGEGTARLRRHWTSFRREPEAAAEHPCTWLASGACALASGLRRNGVSVCLTGHQRLKSIHF